MTLQTEVCLDFLDGVEYPEHVQADPAIQGDSWIHNDSDFETYCQSSLVANVDDIIRSQLGKLAPGVGVDIAGGANGMALRQLMAEGVISQGIVTNWTEKREDTTKSIASLKHVAGGILERETWLQLLGQQETLAPEGASLIMHRPSGALQDLSPCFYGGAAHLLLDRIRPGGILFTQIPFGIEVDPRCDEYLATIEDRADVAEMHRPFWKMQGGAILAVKAEEPL